MRDRMFVNAGTLGLLVAAMTSHQLAQEDLEMAQEDADDASTSVVEAHQQVADEEAQYVLTTASTLMRSFGTNMKMCVIRALKDMFEMSTGDAKEAVDRVDAYLRKHEPLLYTKEAVHDIEAASARCEKTEMCIARFVRENAELIDEALRSAFDDPDNHEGEEAADELHNLILDADEAGNQLAEAIHKPSRV